MPHQQCDNSRRSCNRCLSAGCSRRPYGKAGAYVRPRRSSDRYSRLCLVLADRGQHEAAVLRGAASASRRSIARELRVRAAIVAERQHKD
jgi:hypothetical protein